MRSDLVLGPGWSVLVLAREPEGSDSGFWSANQRGHEPEGSDLVFWSVLLRKSRLSRRAPVRGRKEAVGLQGDVVLTVVEAGEEVFENPELAEDGFGTVVEADRRGPAVD